VKGGAESVRRLVEALCSLKGLKSMDPSISIIL
jgi:hypothetical protein